MLIVSWHLVNIYLEKNTVCHFFILIVCPSGPTICEILAISSKQNSYSISEILAMCRKKRSPTSTLEKVTLNYLIFLILYKDRIFCHLFFFQKLAIFGFVLQSNQKANHSQMCKKMTMFKKILCLKSIHEKNPFSLSKWSNYPSSFHNMSQNNIQEILSQKLICNFGKVFKYL